MVLPRSKFLGDKLRGSYIVMQTLKRSLRATVLHALNEEKLEKLFSWTALKKTIKHRNFGRQRTNSRNALGSDAAFYCHF